MGVGGAMGTPPPVSPQFPAVHLVAHVRRTDTDAPLELIRKTLADVPWNNSWRSLRSTWVAASTGREGDTVTALPAGPAHRALQQLPGCEAVVSAS